VTTGWAQLGPLPWTVSCPVSCRPSGEQVARAGRGIGKADEKFELLDVIKEDEHGAVYLYEDKVEQKLLVLKRRNCSRCTLRNYMSTLKQFVIWISEPIEQVTARTILSFIDHLLDRRLSAKTINCYLDGIRGF